MMDASLRAEFGQLITFHVALLLHQSSETHYRSVLLEEIPKWKRICVEPALAPW